MMFVHASPFVFMPDLHSMVRTMCSTGRVYVVLLSQALQTLVRVSRCRALECRDCGVPLNCKRVDVEKRWGNNNGRIGDGLASLCEPEQSRQSLQFPDFSAFRRRAAFVERV